MKYCACSVLLLLASGCTQAEMVLANAGTGRGAEAFVVSVSSLHPPMRPQPSMTTRARDEFRIMCSNL